MANVKQTDILTGSIPRQLLAFFLPIWFGTLFQQLYNTADTLIVGNFVGTRALAAVGATGASVNLLVGLRGIMTASTARYTRRWCSAWSSVRFLRWQAL